MQDAPKAVWRISYVSVTFFPSLKQNFIAYRSSKVSSCPDCIFEIHQEWKSSFSRVYSNCCCSCSFEAEITKIGQSSHKMYSNKILNFQESTTILNGNLLKAPRTYIHTNKKPAYIFYICFSNINIFTRFFPFRSFLLIHAKLRQPNEKYSAVFFFIIWCIFFLKWKQNSNLSIYFMAGRATSSVDNQCLYRSGESQLSFIFYLYKQLWITNKEA